MPTPTIKRTKDYGIFHFVDFNRQITPSHVANMMRSIETVNATDLKPIVVKPLDKKYATKDHL